MLGRYLAREFKEDKILSLGLREESDFKVDLTKDTPHFEDHFFETVIHCGGTEDDEKALLLNLEGTKRLLEALDQNPPSYFVYISSHKVYSRDAGENITEDTNLWATSEAGKSKALTESILRGWSERHNVTLTIIRPARMFGNGVGGETLRLFNDAITGKYIHIRGNDSQVSLVCALDVAKGVRQIYKSGGIYNAADAHPVKYIEMVEAMTANAGAKKRMTHLPPQWAEWLWRLGRWIPSIDRNLSPEVVEARLKSQTLDGSKFSEATGIEYHDTIAVIERIDKSYPYSSGQQEQKKKVHEV